MSHQLHNIDSEISGHFWKLWNFDSNYAILYCRPNMVCKMLMHPKSYVTWLKDWPYFRQMYLCISAQPCVCSDWFKPCGRAHLRLESYSQTNSTLNEFSCCSLYAKPHITIVINTLWVIIIILVLPYCTILLYHWTWLA